MFGFDLPSRMCLFTQCIASPQWIHLDRSLSSRPLSPAPRNDIDAVQAQLDALHEDACRTAKANATACDTGVCVSCARPGGDRICSMMKVIDELCSRGRGRWLLRGDGALGLGQRISKLGLKSHHIITSAPEYVLCNKIVIAGLGINLTAVFFCSLPQRSSFWVQLLGPASSRLWRASISWNSAPA